MNIQITTKSGQKYLLKGDELVEGFEKYLSVRNGWENHEIGYATDAFEKFLSTYEKEPEEEHVCYCSEKGV